MSAPPSARARVERVERLEQLAVGLRERELDVLLVCAPVNLRYLTGFSLASSQQQQITLQKRYISELGDTCNLSSSC